MFPLSEDKVQLKSYLSRQTDKRFREFVAQKYHIFIRGQFSYEIERALIYYMDKGPMQFSEDRAHAHISTNMCTLGDQRQEQKDISRLKAEQLIEEISAWVMKDYKRRDPPTEIAHETLRRAVIAVKGIQDRRSIKAAIDLLSANGLLKGIGNKVYEIPYNKTSRSPPAPPVERGMYREV
jgi:hypothetical protein